jgi:manganese oxidase
MPMPDNTLPMMTGFGQFGPIEMGGMFSVVKVREGLARDDYKDPGWYQHPSGTVAYEVKGSAPEAPRRHGTATPAHDEIEVTVVKPRNSGHENQH